MSDKLTDSNLLSKVNKLVAFVGSLVALLSAIWGILVPVSNFLEEKHRRYELSLSNEMIRQIDEVHQRDFTKANNAILRLSAYEEDAIPYLLYAFEIDSLTLKQQTIIRAIQIIKNVNKVDDVEVVERILQAAELYFIRKNNKIITEQEKTTIYSSIELLGLTGCEKKNDIAKIFKKFENEAFEVNKDSLDPYFINVSKNIKKANALLLSDVCNK